MSAFVTGQVNHRLAVLVQAPLGIRQVPRHVRALPIQNYTDSGPG